MTDLKSNKKDSIDVYIEKDNNEELSYILYNYYSYEIIDGKIINDEKNSIKIRSNNFKIDEENELINFYNSKDELLISMPAGKDNIEKMENKEESINSFCKKIETNNLNKFFF